MELGFPGNGVVFRGCFPALSLPAPGVLGFSSRHIPGQELLMDNWLEISLCHLGYSQWEFGIPRKGWILENWWGGVGGWIPCFSGVFHGFSHSRLEFQLG